MFNCSIDADRPDQTIVAAVADIVRQGGVIVYPTETVYGLGGDAFNHQVIDRIYALKGRDQNKPLSIIISSLDWLERLVTKVPLAAQQLMERFWPGPLTLVLSASHRVPQRLKSNQGTIAVRISGSLFCTCLVDAAGCPLVATSANRSGQGECTSLQSVPPDITTQADALVDGGPSAGREVSTVVDMTVTPYQIKREGAVSRAQIEKALA